MHQEYIIPADAPYPNYNRQEANLTKAKKANSELKRTNAQVLQQVIKTLERAFSNMKQQGDKIMNNE
ncbi:MULTISPECIES: hypothetical protein [Okeania]|uniref:hypothetical protein n=1 Tax=Okeania TaxID=1458928 RepID=UPI001F01CDED|nr:MULTISPECIES: hypothetical protein [Okeania]